MKHIFCTFLLLSFLTSIANNWVCDNEPEWINCCSKPVKTIFYQGIFASQAQAGKYMGRRGFYATTGEYISWQRPIEGIYDLFIGTEIDEIIPTQAHGYSTTQILSPFNWYSMLLELFASRSHSRFGITVTPSQENLKQSQSLLTFSVDISKISMGQEVDIACHQRKYEACLESCQETDLIFFGFSRGATTTLNALVCNGYDFSRIKLIVLEGCYDSLGHLLEIQFPSTYGLIHKMIEYCLPAYSMTGRCPLKSISQFPLNIPVAFITSAKDALVPSCLSKNLAHLLAQAGHKEVYLLELEHSSHPGYTQDNYEDAANFQYFLHALYKKYSLPYIAKYAENGIYLLNLCQVKEN